ncbi:hypothetical protein [Paenibacillus sp. R14(2021)]|uniref:hypothetical protein n=1 Tax=Paenibacillus sp. R14(2021) TaxID=2859228 RepID=UPI001C6161F8|nr:hypothetical protein [Paenibacillus sp. R14(2021)]
MSNATIIQTNTDIFIGSDTATSISVGNQIYRVDTKATKLYHIDELVLFCSGDLVFCYNLIELFLKEEVRSANVLRNILLACHHDETVDIVVCEYKGNKSVVTQLSPYNNFELVIYTDIPVGGVNVIAAGIKTKESYDKACELLYKGISVSNIFKEVFDTVSYEGIGGQLSVYRVSENGIQVFLNHQIKEKQSLKRVSPAIFTNHNKQLIVGERIYGKVMMGASLAIEDESGVLKFQGSKGEIFDRDGTLVMKMGLVDENPDTFGLWSFNVVTRVRMDDKTGFAIERASTDTTNHPNGWEKILWADQSDGTLYGYDIVAQNIKIVNNVGDSILDAENNYLNIGGLESIVMDNKLTTLEKMQIITELYKIEAQYKRMLEQADKYMQSDRDAIFDVDAQFFAKTSGNKDLYSTQPLTNAYFALITYMSQYLKVNSTLPLSIDIDDPLTESTSKISDRAEFILKFKNYYDAEKDLRNKIEDAQFYSGLNMGQFYNNVVIGEYGFIALRNDGKYRSVLNATNGLTLQKWENNKWMNKVYASIGSSVYDDGTLIAEDLVAKRLRIETSTGKVLLDAESLSLDFTVLDSIVLDNVIMSPEKIALATQFNNITKQYTELKAEITKYATTVYRDRDSSYYGLDTAKTALVAAGTDLDEKYNTLNAYMIPVFADMNAKTDIINDLNSTRIIFHQVWEDFYKAYEVGRSTLADFLEKSSLQLGRNYNNTVIDGLNGIVVTRGNFMNKTTLNATFGIKIERNDGTAESPAWYKVFYADINGNLFAEDMSTKRLHILDGDLGEAIILNALTGITINGRHGEVIRLNANEGIAINVNDEQRFWIHTDGTLRARKLYISNDDIDPLELPDGSYISRLTVHEVRTLQDDNPQDYVWIRDQSVKLMSGNGAIEDQEKMAIYLDSPAGDLNGIPTIKMGVGSGVGASEVGYIVKDGDAFKLNYLTGGGLKRIWMQRTGYGTEGILIESIGNAVRLNSSTMIRLEVGSSYLEITPTGIKLSASRIDIN